MVEGPVATVVGGGIAGLASAVSLLQAGWTVTIVERAPEFGEVGAGVAITVNGMAALDALGVGSAVRSVGHQTRTAGYQDPDGRWLLRTPNLPAEKEPAIWLCAVHRQRLHAALLQATNSASLITGATVTSMEPGSSTGPRAAVRFQTEGGEQVVESDLVVAADGVRSSLRAQLFPHIAPQYGGATSWRAVINDTDRLDDRFIAAWGAGVEFGALRISSSEVYWYGYFLHAEGAALEDELGAAQEMFSGWPTWVTDTVAATTATQLMRHDVYHLPHGVPSYVRGRVVIVGDAAHAFLPTMGQGVASAVEDGVTVGRLIAQPVQQGADLNSALAAYDRSRRPRCQRIARQSAMIGRLGAHLGGGRRQQLRNNLIRLVPGSLAIKGGRAALTWAPPEASHLTGAAGSARPPASSG